VSVPAADDAPSRPVRRRVHRVGDRGLLVECEDLAEVHGLHAALTAAPLPGQGEIVPAARTVLVLLTDRARAQGLAAALSTVRVAPSRSVDGEEVVVDVVYDGADLGDVARLRAVSHEAVVRWHTERPWTAAFLGFAPGFAYLERDEASWDVPRRDTPRTAVPAGAVGLAGPYSAVYPRASPGGWQLVGRTAAVMWDGARPDPTLVRTGDRVRFRAVRAEVVAASLPATPAPAPPSPSQGDVPRAVPAIEVVAPGPLTLVEDLGRPGHRAIGVGPSGAVDRRAAVRANRLVGNPRGAAVLEVLLGGLELRARGLQVLAVTGAPALAAVRTPDGTVRDRPAHASPFAVRDGETLTLEPPAGGLRSYVAVRGGLGAEPVLGSRSTDVLSGLGPAPLTAGTVVPVLPPPADAVAAWPDPPADPLVDRPGPVLRVRVVVGPRADRLTDEGVRSLLTQEWQVTADSNRVGLRLAGEPLDRARHGELHSGLHGELPSEAVVAGAVQVPPSGLPVVFLADHPVTGGYPVVAVVRDADVDLLAQVRPGDRVRFSADDAPGGRLVT
jgi:KipI family sensor histidine kinase inhibitor